MNFRFPSRARVKNYTRTELDGYSFGSKLEAAVYAEYKRDPEIVVTRTQVHVHLSAARILYVCDLELKNIVTGDVFYAEAKGFESERWPIIKKLWAHYGPGPLQIWKGSYQRPRVVEKINPNAQTKESF